MRGRRPIFQAVVRAAAAASASTTASVGPRKRGRLPLTPQASTPPTATAPASQSRPCRRDRSASTAASVNGARYAACGPRFPARLPANPAGPASSRLPASRHSVSTPSRRQSTGAVGIAQQHQVLHPPRGAPDQPPRDALSESPPPAFAQPHHREDHGAPGDPLQPGRAGDPHQHPDQQRTAWRHSWRQCKRQRGEHASDRPPLGGGQAGDQRLGRAAAEGRVRPSPRPTAARPGSAPGLPPPRPRPRSSTSAAPPAHGRAPPRAVLPREVAPAAGTPRRGSQGAPAGRARAALARAARGGRPGRRRRKAPPAPPAGKPARRGPAAPTARTATRPAASALPPRALRLHPPATKGTTTGPGQGATRPLPAPNSPAAGPPGAATLVAPADAARRAGAPRRRQGSH